MILEQFSPLVQVILLGFGSMLLIFLALWYILRLPSWLERRKKLALYRAIMRPRATTARAHSSQVHRKSTSQNTTDTLNTKLEARSPQHKSPLVAQGKRPSAARVAKGYADFKQRRQQDPSSKLSNDRFRGANAIRTEDIKNLKVTLPRQAKPKLPPEMIARDSK